VPKTDRAGFLRLGVAGLAAVGAGTLATPAAAALPAPAPQGDDVGFLVFGAVAERASLAWYRDALRVRGFSRGERRRLETGAGAKVAHIQRLNGVLGPDAVAAGDFAADFPRSDMATRERALALGGRLEGLLVGVYLNGAAFARDSATRLLLGRLLAYDAQQLAWMRTLSGVAAGGLPDPLSVEQAGAQLDSLITTPSFTS
jgi:hypothetical protein